MATVYAGTGQGHFNPRSPHGERQRLPAGNALGGNFNPRSPHGERLQLFAEFFFKFVFQSTLPARGATVEVLCRSRRFQHFNPRSPHGERRNGRRSVAHLLPISIHAPRTGSDGNHGDCRQHGRHFNPRSPHGERPYFRSYFRITASYFNPRSPHGERRCRPATFPLPAYFNPRSPHGERLTRRARLSKLQNFNPRSPHGERPAVGEGSGRKSSGFQSTLPARGATEQREEANRRARISIHAPRTGSDWIARVSAYIAANFNPRSPHGERLALAR